MSAEEFERIPETGEEFEAEVFAEAMSPKQQYVRMMFVSFGITSPVFVIVIVFFAFPGNWLALVVAILIAALCILSLVYTINRRVHEASQGFNYFFSTTYAGRFIVPEQLKIYSYTPILVPDTKLGGLVHQKTPDLTPIIGMIERRVMDDVVAVLHHFEKSEDYVVVTKDDFELLAGAAEGQLEELKALEVQLAAEEAEEEEDRVPAVSEGEAPVEEPLEAYSIIEEVGLVPETENPSTKQAPLGNESDTKDVAERREPPKRKTVKERKTKEKPRKPITDDFTPEQLAKIKRVLEE